MHGRISTGHAEAIMIQEITTFIAQRSVAAGWSITQNWVIGTNLFAGTVPVKNALGANIPVRYLAVLENAGGAVLADVGGCSDCHATLSIG